jgi:5-carboxymethyl-2-hydroxymuconate isomerase
MKESSMKKVKTKNSSQEFTVGKIVCVGRNYAEHAKELGNEVPEKPVVFLKPASALIHMGEKIIHPTFSKDMHHEVELVLLIGKTVKDVAANEAENAIIGYGVGLDMTLRDVQNELKKKGHPWTIAKCFDTSAVVSDFILKSDYNLTLDEEISLSVNRQIRQKEKLNKMLFRPADIVEYISSLMTLEEGDLVFTGTPAGVGKVEVGDRLSGRIEGVGELEVEVV